MLREKGMRLAEMLGVDAREVEHVLHVAPRFPERNAFDKDIGGLRGAPAQPAIDAGRAGIVGRGGDDAIAIEAIVEFTQIQRP